MNKVLHSSKNNSWETPPSFFDELNSVYNFTLDPCATKETAKCDLYFTKEDDGLIQDWTGHTVFCNPPYGREIGKWVEKCSKEKATVVMLIPARTDTKYFHNYIYKKPNVDIEFLKGRLKFRMNGKELDPAPFPSMVVVFKNMIKESF